MREKKKILIFGNGISMRYAYDEYNYPALMKKMKNGLEVSHKRIMEYFDSISIPIIKSTFKDEAINESLWFKIYKRLVVANLNKTHRTKATGFKDGEEAWDCIYQSIVENLDPGDSIDSTILFIFVKVYSAMNYAIKRSVSINNDNDDFIRIKYPKEFIDKLKTYHSTFTTNYYFGCDDYKPGYLHGEVEVKSNFKFHTKYIDRNKTIGNEFDEYNKPDILFGGCYDDKVFLNTLLKRRRGEGLERREIVDGKIDFSCDEVHIVGMSTEGDKDLIEKVIRDANKVVIFYNSPRSEKDWSSIAEKNPNVRIEHNSKFFDFE